MQEDLRIQARPVLHDPVLILAFEGWNDAGEAATCAARHLVDLSEAALLAEIDPEEFYDFTVRRPQVTVEAGIVRGVEWPSTEFRYGSVGSAQDLVVGIGVEPHMRWRHFADRVIRLARDAGIRQVALLGAYLGDVLYSRPVTVTGVASSPAFLERGGVQPTRYQGPTGIVGVLSERFREEGVETVSLWAGLPHYISVSPNPRGALALLQTLAGLFQWRLDLAPLERLAAEFEERVSALVASDPELGEYVRQLKRREFVQ